MSGFGFGFLDPDDPRVKEMEAEMTRQHEVFHMQREEALHDVEDLLQSLDSKQLRVLANLLGVGMEGGKKSRITLSIWYGQIHRIIAEKEKLCAACLGNHDDELKDILGPETAVTPKESVEAEIMAKALEYHMKQEEDGWHCVLCGMQYMSLDDRMLMPADEGGCPGCRNKTKWGG